MINKSKILVVDDTLDSLKLLSDLLKAEGYEVHSAISGELAIESAISNPTELVLLDILMPGMDGFEVCRRLRAESNVPVVMLTVRSDEADIVKALDIGADDYVTKPFSPKELVARLRAVLRRSTAVDQPQGRNRISTGPFILDAQYNAVSVSDQRVRLTPLEFRLFWNLVANEGRVMALRSIIRNVWGYPQEDGCYLVKTHIRHLRVKLEANPDSPEHIKTVRGVGYVFFR